MSSPECKIIGVMNCISQDSTKEEKQVGHFLSPVYLLSVYLSIISLSLSLSQGIVSGDCGSWLRKFEIHNAGLHKEKIMVSMKFTVTGLNCCSQGEF